MLEFEDEHRACNLKVLSSLNLEISFSLDTLFSLSIVGISFEAKFNAAIPVITAFVESFFLDCLLCLVSVDNDLDLGFFSSTIQAFLGLDNFTCSSDCLLNFFVRIKARDDIVASGIHNFFLICKLY